MNDTGRKAIAGVSGPGARTVIESGPPIQRAWYHGQSSDSNRVLILDDGNQAFIDPISRRTNIYGPPAGSTASLGASSAVGESSEDTTSVQSFKSEASPETPSLRDCSVQSRSPGSPALPLTPRCMYNHAYNTPATYILPTIPHAPGTVEQVELEVLRPSGAVVVAGMVDNDRTPTRDNFGGGGGGAATATPRRIADGFARVNGTTIMNAPSAPRSRGASRGQAHYRGGRPTRIWNWRN
ncbi:hypothetical protein EYC84_007311 [Monilinia fructicola]|uniref:Uncharacterized protein n=1 Tax=Monilinia fructicola TaxID=38448 RepID=A0A5M9KA12_MONFR|nr:hypothetical protein EYC84_007311 [Monilinia fructicola]